MTHSKEPWKLTMDMILDATESVVAAQRGPSGLTKGDMQRIVICVNACKGVSNEALEQGQVQLVSTVGVIAYGPKLYSTAGWTVTGTTVNNKKVTP